MKKPYVNGWITIVSSSIQAQRIFSTGDRPVNLQFMPCAKRRFQDFMKYPLQGKTQFRTFDKQLDAEQVRGRRHSGLLTNNWRTIIGCGAGQNHITRYMVYLYSFTSTDTEIGIHPKEGRQIHRNEEAGDLNITKILLSNLQIKFSAVPKFTVFSTCHPICEWTLFMPEAP